ncbi:hypothetical protein GCM10010832_18990 [Psychroflexus planctonicus]|uniref:Antitoxin Xre/MbcA/ParS-like toxin-binding domain-containing protein n=2 Tax=Psychroflexus planctonicus TaxID=1526575 RepID=A0ABQ1SIW0_9FLAO|nr:hypothetical protein GCM10010832_18990 [Psychroflexus planctonicus]
MSRVMEVEKYEEYTTNLKGVNEAMLSYVLQIDNSSKKHINVEEFNYSNFFEDKMLIIQAIKKGITYSLFNKIKRITPFTEDDWASYLNVSKKTLQRHSNDDDYIFKPIHTEKIIELAEVNHFGNEVFDTKDQFYLWLSSPSFALGNLKPAELLTNSYGKELVMAELNRIDHGIFV